jgi:invasion protein IalB
VRVETTRHGGWALTCQDFTEPKPRRTCQGLIQVGQPNTNQVLFTWLMARGDDGRIVNTLQTLPGVSIPQGISFRVGKGTARPVPFATCEPTHCTGTFVADDAFLREAETAETAEALVVGSNGRGVQFKIDAKGVERIVAALRR